MGKRWNGITFSFRKIENGFLVSCNELSEDHLKPKEYYCLDHWQVEDLISNLTLKVFQESIEIEPEDGE